jgi:hypothetical protein
LRVALVARTRDIGAVQPLAQGPVVAELHDRQVAGHLERQLVAALAFCFGGGPRGLHHVGWHAIQFVRGGVVGEGVGGVQRVLAEFWLSSACLSWDLREALLGQRR